MVLFGRSVTNPHSCHPFVHALAATGRPRLVREEAEQDKLQPVREPELQLPECSGMAGTAETDHSQIIWAPKGAESRLEERGRTEYNIWFKQC